MHIVVVCGTNRNGALSRLLAAEVAESYRSDTWGANNLLTNASMLGGTSGLCVWIDP